MTRDEAVKLLQATRLMLMDGANQPISDLYYALDMAIEALEQTEPQSVCPVSIVFFCDECHREKCDRKTEPNCSEKPNNSTSSKMEQVDKDTNVRSKDEPKTDIAEDIVRSYGFKAESYQQAKAKDEPQTDCDHKCIQTEIGCEQTDCAWGKDG